MLTHRMYIHFQLTPRAPKGSSKGKVKARAKMPTSIVNGRLLLDWYRIMGFMSEYLYELRRIDNVRGVNHDRAWDLFCDLILLDPVTMSKF